MCDLFVTSSVGVFEAVIRFKSVCIKSWLKTRKEKIWK